MSKLRKFLNWFVIFVVPILFLIYTFFILKNNLFYEFEIKGRLLGYIAYWLLAFILLIKPIIIIFNLKKLKKYLSYRKELGILTFYFALFHVVFVTLFHYKILKFDELEKSVVFFFFNFFIKDKYNFIGFLGLIILFILTITSNKFSMKLLKNKWKKLHYSVYLAFILLSLHSYFITREIIYVITLVIFIILKILEFKGVKIIK